MIVVGDKIETPNAVMFSYIARLEESIDFYNAYIMETKDKLVAAEAHLQELQQTLLQCRSQEQFSVTTSE